MPVAIGIAAARGANALKSRVSAFGQISRWAPYLSAVSVLGIGCVVVAQGATGLGLI